MAETSSLPFQLATKPGRTQDFPAVSIGDVEGKAAIGEAHVRSIHPIASDRRRTDLRAVLPNLIGYQLCCRAFAAPPCWPCADSRLRQLAMRRAIYYGLYGLVGGGGGGCGGGEGGGGAEGRRWRRWRRWRRTGSRAVLRPLDDHIVRIGPGRRRVVWARRTPCGEADTKSVELRVGQPRHPAIAPEYRRTNG